MAQYDTIAIFVDSTSILYKTFYDKGHTKMKCYQLRTLGNREGAAECFYKHGTRERIAYYTYDTLDSVFHYYPNGQLKYKGNFEKGKLMTTDSSFSIDGKPLYPGMIISGNGMRYSYHDNGTIKHITAYQDGAKHGVDSEFDLRGHLQYVRLIDKNTNTVVLRYKKNLTLASKTSYKNGMAYKTEDYFTFGFAKGKIKRLWLFVGDELIEFISYRRNGKIKERFRIE